MRILMTADTVGGIWTYALELARMLAGKGDEIVLATMGPRPTDSQREEAKRVPHLVLLESDFKLEWMEDCWKDVDAAGRWLLGLEAELRPDVVHLNGYCHALLPFSAPKVVVGHSCVLSWWQHVKKTSAPAEWDEYVRRVSAGLAAADYVVAPSQSMLECLQTHYGHFSNASVIYNGRDPRQFVLTVKEQFVFTSGRLWDEAKNVRLVALAAPRMDWPVYVAGPGGEEAAGKGVNYLGTLPAEEHARWLSRASVFALPARYEPFGLGPLEAALSGCALVLGDIPSLREVWSDAAIYVDPFRLDELADAVNSVARDRRLWAKMSGAARRRAQVYQPQAMADQYRALYRQLITERTTPSTANAA